jgi:hypothetical protein
VGVAIQVALLAKAVAKKLDVSEEISRRLESGAAPTEVRVLLGQFLADGGPASLAQQALDVVANLPESMRSLDTDGNLRAVISQGPRRVAGMSAMESRAV